MVQVFVNCKRHIRETLWQFRYDETKCLRFHVFTIFTTSILVILHIIFSSEFLTKSTFRFNHIRQAIKRTEQFLLFLCLFTRCTLTKRYEDSSLVRLFSSFHFFVSLIIDLRFLIFRKLLVSSVLLTRSFCHMRLAKSQQKIVKLFVPTRKIRSRQIHYEKIISTSFA